MQECRERRKWDFPSGWHVRRAGELLVASVYPIERVEVSHCRWPPPKLPSKGDVNAIYCILATPDTNVGFCAVHLDTPRRGLEAVLDRRKVLDLAQVWYANTRIHYRRRESEDLARWLGGSTEPKIVASDWNMPTDSRIYREFWVGYANAFGRAGFGYGHTSNVEKSFHLETATKSPLP